MIQLMDKLETKKTSSLHSGKRMKTSSTTTVRISSEQANVLAALYPHTIYCSAYLQIFKSCNPRTVLEVAKNLQPQNFPPASIVGECALLSDFFFIEGTNWMTSFQNRFQTISTEQMTTLGLYWVAHHKETYRTLMTLKQRMLKFGFKARHSSTSS